MKWQVGPSPDRGCNGGSQVFLSIASPSTIFSRHLYHAYNHPFRILNWPPLHAERLPHNPHNYFPTLYIS
jgi:hypothetical protein